MKKSKIDMISLPDGNIIYVPKYRFLFIFWDSFYYINANGDECMYAYVNKHDAEKFLHHKGL